MLMRLKQAKKLFQAVSVFCFSVISQSATAVEQESPSNAR